MKCKTDGCLGASKLHGLCRKCDNEISRTKGVTMKCLTDGCVNEQKCRNLCWNCYQNAQRYVKAGKATWKELEDSGACGTPRFIKGESSFHKSMRNKLPTAPGDIQSCLQPVTKSIPKIIDSMEDVVADAMQPQITQNGKPILPWCNTDLDKD